MIFHSFRGLRRARQCARTLEERTGLLTRPPLERRALEVSEPETATTGREAKLRHSTTFHCASKCAAFNFADSSGYARNTLRSLPSLRVLMDRKVKDGKRGAANNRKKYLSAMFSWAVKNRHMIANPCRDVERASYSTDGFHTWTVDEVRHTRPG